jgi:hypothetical protein
MHVEFWLGNVLENVHLEDRHGAGAITLRWIFERGCEDRRRMELTQDHVQWWALVPWM